MKTVNISSLFGGSTQELNRPMIGSVHMFPPLTTGLGASWQEEDGSLISRTGFPQWWEWVVATQGGNLLSDSDWLALRSSAPNGAVSAYSTGDGSTTFRCPTVGTDGGFARAKGTSETDPVLLNIGFGDGVAEHKHIAPVAYGDSDFLGVIDIANIDNPTLGGFGQIAIPSTPALNSGVAPDRGATGAMRLTSKSIHEVSGETHPKGSYKSFWIFTGVNTKKLAPVPTLEQIMEGLNSRNILYNTGHEAKYRPINQRSFDGNWAGLAIGAHGYDGWVKYSATHKAQIIEPGDFENKAYMLSFDGVNQGLISPKNITDPWLVAVPFTADEIDLRPDKGFGFWQAEEHGTKLAKCQRYYFHEATVVAHPLQRWHNNNSTESKYIAVNYSFAVSMRKIPVTRVWFDIKDVDQTSKVLLHQTSTKCCWWQDIVDAKGWTDLNKIDIDATFTIADAKLNISD